MIAIHFHPLRCIRLQCCVSMLSAANLAIGTQPIAAIYEWQIRLNDMRNGIGIERPKIHRIPERFFLSHFLRDWFRLSYVFAQYFFSPFLFHSFDANCSRTAETTYFLNSATLVFHGEFANCHFIYIPEDKFYVACHCIDDFRPNTPIPKSDFLCSMLDIKYTLDSYTYEW